MTGKARWENPGSRGIDEVEPWSTGDPTTMGTILTKPRFVRERARKSDASVGAWLPQLTVGTALTLAAGCVLLMLLVLSGNETDKVVSNVSTILSSWGAAGWSLWAWTFAVDRKWNAAEAGSARACCP